MKFGRRGMIAVHSVPTAKGSEPLHSLLVIQNESSTTTRTAPASVETAEFCIVLSTLSVVASVVIVAGAAGYGLDDAPLVDLWSSNLLTDTDRNYVDRMDIKAEVATGRSVGGSSQSFQYRLHGAVTARIFWSKLSLPSAVGRISTSMVAAQPVMDLLSFHNPSPRTKKYECKLCGVTSCIHVQRILVLGQQLPQDSDPRFLTESVIK